MGNYDRYYLEDKADELGNKIEKQYDRYGVKIGVGGGSIKKDRIIFEVKPKGATRWPQILARGSDVQLKLKLHLFQPFKDSFDTFIAVSETEIQYDRLPKILASPAYAEAKKKMKLPYVVGYNVMGELVIVDLALERHALIGGSTGSGKTVALRCLLLSTIAGKSPEKVNLILIDTGANDLMPFEGIPHLSCPVARDRETALKYLTALRDEMDRRKDLELTNIDEFRLLPRLVCVIDEYSELISGTGDKQMSKPLTEIVSSLLRLGRHYNIHLVLAAQNPTLQNMKCDLGNVTARIAFTCAKSNFSMTILDESGAEHLLGNGDMYFKSPQFNGLQRIQGVFITPGELKRAIADITMKSLRYRDSDNKFLIAEADLQEAGAGNLTSTFGKTKRDADDKLFASIIIWAVGRESISCNMICDTFKVGWRRAKGFLDKLHSLEIAGDMYEKLPRAVLPVDLDDLSPETLAFLGRYGYTSEDVTEALDSKVNQ